MIPPDTPSYQGFWGKSQPAPALARGSEPDLALARGNGVHFLHFRGFSCFFAFAGIRPGPGSAPAKRLQIGPGIQGLGRPGFSKMGGKGPGRKRSVSVAGGLVGTGGKFRGGHFLVCSIARVFSAGFPKRGSKTPRFLPITEPLPSGLQLQHSSSTASPIYEGCARMNPVGPRTCSSSYRRYNPVLGAGSVAYSCQVHAHNAGEHERVPAPIDTRHFSETPRKRDRLLERSPRKGSFLEATL